jgi:outer membrane protein TolC
MKQFVLIFSLFACVVLSPSRELSAQKGRPLRIGVVVDGPWERNEDLRELLQKEITEVLGKAVPVVFPPEAFLIGNWTLSGVTALDSRLLGDPQIDMVLGMGLITSQDLATRGPLPKPAIAPIIIDVDRQHVPAKNGTSGIKNLSYLVYPMTFVRDLQLYREIIPIKKLVNISSKPYDDVLPPPHSTIEEIGRKLGLEVKELYLGFSADEVLTALPTDADAVFLEPTLHLPPAEFQKLVRGFIERRLPSFSFLGENEVRQGIMASANPDIVPRLVRRIALNIQRIVEGEEPGSLAVAFTPGKRLTINMGTAYAVGVSPKWSTLLEAELTDVNLTTPGGMSLTFSQAIRQFSEQNLDIQAKIREVMAEANNVRTARAALLPNIEVSASGLQIDKDRAEAGATPQRSGTLDLTATQVILAEPAIANLSIQSSLQESREQDLEITRLNTIVDGSKLYINYLRARQIFYILLDNLRLMRTNLELARVRQTTGAAGQEETLRWEVEIANLRKIAMEAQSQMNQALYGLKQVLNIPLLYVLNVSDVSLDDSSMLISNKELRGYLEDPLSFELLSDFLTSEGARRAPELRQLDLVISAQERALTSTRLSYFLPTLSAFGKYTDRFYKSEVVSPFQLPPLSSAPPPATLGEEFLYKLLGAFSPKLPGDQSWSVGIQLSLNLFNGLATRASEDRTSMLLEQYRVQRIALAEKVALRIRLEMEKAKSSYFSIQQAKLEQDAARKTLEIVTESYSRGAVSILSLLDAQNSALRADQVAANALYDFFVDYLSLQRAIGEVDVLLTAQEREDLLQRLSKHMAAVRKR